MDIENVKNEQSVEYDRKYMGGTNSITINPDAQCKMKQLAVDVSPQCKMKQLDVYVSPHASVISFD